ncbi:granulocyte colony-stimulating factor receptor [Misgurnus anguillicaudatus]|uniref:granulocyte colony-stimulating factor receptor n=1 Tax=Misgurnus anguillicaudatus TaxID=75329 RepID=UPI003CCF7336
MTSVWLSVLVVLWIHMNGLLKGAKACGEVKTSSSVVPVGSSISASCLINSDCPLTKGKKFRVEWKINNDLVPSNLSYLESNGTYIVVIPHIPVARAVITCSVCVEDNCQVVDGSLVKVAYPPPIPTNLSCVLNVNDPVRMLCQWNPGLKMENIDLNYTLHTKISATSKRCSYMLPAGVHSYWIPRQDIQLFSEMEIYVEVENTFWNTSSARLLVIPMKTAKYGPPEIQGIEDYELGCLEYTWSLTESQNWVKLTFDVELSLKEVNNQQAKELVISKKASQDSTIKVCGLSHWTNYSTKIRVRYSNLWSEWSDPKVATTLARAPSGRLDTWLKVPADGGVTAQLYWKPSQQFRANSENLSYIIESKKPKQTLCVTTEDHCFFNISKWVQKVYLTARNRCGKSTPTEVPVYRMKALDPVSNLIVHSQSNTSVLLVWESLVSSRVMGYVLEWRSLTESPKLFFTLLTKNDSSTVVTGLEPYKPYEISIYPKYVDGIGRSLTVIAYTSETAPSVAPKLTIKEIHSSNVQLVWDEIPLKQRNGIIQGYTIFIWDEKNHIEIIKTKMTNVLMKDVQPFSTYHFLISVHTLGGSLNGTVVTLKTKIGHIEILLFVIPVCVGFALLILIAVFACLGKHERLKMCLWPIIPDPANSSIRRWTTTESLQGMPPFKEDKDPVLVYLSHFSLLDLSDKEICNSDYVKGNLWSHDSGSRDEGHNLFQTPSSYDSQQDTDSVPYATVVFSGPYQNQTGSPPTYLRSESTQPLLGMEESGSPPPYENLSESVSKVNYFTTFPLEPTENEVIWEDFPMLRSLEIRNSNQI